MHSRPEPELAEAVLTDWCHLRIPSLPQWIEPTVNYLVARAVQTGALLPARANRLTIALHEALSNAVIHGNLEIPSTLKDQEDHAFMQALTERCANPTYANRVVDVLARYDGQKAQWILTDEGAGFDYETLLAQLDETPPDPQRASGRGLLLIRAFVDEMRFSDGGRKLSLTIRKTFSSEKRSCPRTWLTRGIHVAPLSSTGEIDWCEQRPALMRNISPEGIALLQTGLQSSDRVLIRIPTSAEPIILSAEIKHVRDLGDNLVELGCRFETSMPLDLLGANLVPDAAHRALAQLVHRLHQSQTPVSERRAGPRVSYTESIRVEIPGERTLRGFGRDLSRLGISFFCTVNLSEQTLMVCLPAGDREDLRLPAQVVRCTPMIDGFYEVAARFVTPS